MSQCDWLSPSTFLTRLKEFLLEVFLLGRPKIVDPRVCDFRYSRCLQVIRRFSMLFLSRTTCR